jgi:transposase-like protein
VDAESGCRKLLLTRRIAMAAGDITFVKCPRGDSFPVRKTASLSTGHQQIICPRCGHDFDIVMEETVERLSPILNLKLAMAR